MYFGGCPALQTSLERVKAAAVLTEAPPGSGRMGTRFPVTGGDALGSARADPRLGVPA